MHSHYHRIYTSLYFRIDLHRISSTQYFTIGNTITSYSIENMRGLVLCKNKNEISYEEFKVILLPKMVAGVGFGEGGEVSL